MTKCYEKKATPAIFFMFTLNMCGKEKINMLKDGLKRICISLGRNNDPVIAVLGIAVFKGIFRPLFTMMDKEEKPERKKYAAGAQHVRHRTNRRHSSTSFREPAHMGIVPSVERFYRKGDASRRVTP